MDKIKKFFTKKKSDAKFKRAGEGYRLDQTRQPSYQPGQIPSQPIQQQPRSSTDAQARAAEAALQRIHLGHGAKPSRSVQAIRAEAKKQLDMERQSNAVVPQTDHHGPEERHFESAPMLAVNGVYFTCELLPEDLVLPRDVMVEQVEQFLREQLRDEPLVASSVMIHSLNPIRERRQEAIDILSKYLDNLITYPEEAKYRKIRTSNKVFSEKVAPIKGCAEFLEAVGFTPLAEEGEQTFLVIGEDRSSDTGALIQAKEILVQGEPVPLKLHRNASILRPSAAPLTDLALPRDFFDRTSSELKQEQKEKADEMEKLLSLRTREMRERDEIKRIYRYRYTLIRIRFPDAFMLQGTFSSAERFPAVEEFVKQHILQNEWISFVLKDPRGEAMTPGRTHDRSLAELGLAPASVLHFEWDHDSVKDAAAAGNNVPPGYLRPELLEEMGAD